MAQAPAALRVRVMRALDSPREVSGALAAPAAVILAALAWCGMPSISAAVRPVANPYLEALQRLSQKLDGIHADSDEHRAVQGEIDHLTQTLIPKD